VDIVAEHDRPFYSLDSDFWYSLDSDFWLPHFNH